MEVDFYRDLDSHWMAVFHGGLEFPSSHCFDGLFVETHAQTAQHADVAGAAVGSDYQAQCADALIFGLPSFFGEFRFRSINLPWRRNAATNVEDASPGTAAFTRTKARSLAGSNAAATAGTSAA